MNITKLENKLVVVSCTVGVTVYDFNFELYFATSHPHSFDLETQCVLRIGAIDDYVTTYTEMQAIGLRPVNSPEQHVLSSELAAWYPLIYGLTPYSEIFETLPSVKYVESAFGWPIFLKGSRQTSKHNPDLAVIQDAEQYELVQQSYGADPILHWQKPVIRKFVPLMPVEGSVVGKLRPSLEFRSFWWQGICVGWGNYWYQVKAYACDDIQNGLNLAEEAAKRLQVPFIVIDFAKTLDGRWIVIECNDAQESGYVGILPQQIWRSVLANIDMG